MTVDFMLREMPARELTEWMIAFDYWHIPIDDPEYRAEYRNASLEASIINTAPGRKGRRAKAEELIPQWSREPDETAGERLYREMDGTPRAPRKGNANGITSRAVGRNGARSDAIRQGSRQGDREAPKDKR